MGQDKLSVFLCDAAEMAEQEHVLRVGFQTVAHSFEVSPPGEFLAVIAEHQEVGDLTGERYSLQVGVVKPVHPRSRQAVEVGGVCCLERSAPGEGVMSPVPQAVQYHQDASHKLPFAFSEPCSGSECYCGTRFVAACQGLEGGVVTFITYRV